MSSHRSSRFASYQQYAAISCALFAPQAMAFSWSVRPNVRNQPFELVRGVDVDHAVGDFVAGLIQPVIGGLDGFEQVGVVLERRPDVFLERIERIADARGRAPKDFGA